MNALERQRELKRGWRYHELPDLYGSRCLPNICSLRLRPSRLEYQNFSVYANAYIIYSL